MKNPLSNDISSQNKQNRNFFGFLKMYLAMAKIKVMTPKKRKTKVAVKNIYHILLETPKETYTNLQYNCLKTTLQPMPPITNLL